jgi:uncharacterized protein YcbX
MDFEFVVIDTEEVIRVYPSVFEHIPQRCEIVTIDDQKYTVNNVETKYKKTELNRHQVEKDRFDDYLVRRTPGSISCVKTIIYLEKYDDQKQRQIM